MLFDGAVPGMTQGPLGTDGGTELDELGLLGGIEEDDGKDTDDEVEGAVGTTGILDEGKVLELDGFATTAPFW
jgi:hypothetical protein